MTSCNGYVTSMLNKQTASPSSNDKMAALLRHFPANSFHLLLLSQTIAPYRWNHCMQNIQPAVPSVLRNTPVSDKPRLHRHRLHVLRNASGLQGVWLSVLRRIRARTSSSVCFSMCCVGSWPVQQDHTTLC